MSEALPIEIRTATLADIPYIDHLQKSHSHELGFFATDWLESYIQTHIVVIGLENGEPACYLLGRAGYHGRDDLAIIYQACVQYDARRRCLGRAVVESFMDRLPAESRLLLLWCAQDIEANAFWEAMEFQALAARVGSKRRHRIHILWERPIDNSAEGRAGVRPYVPRVTHGGSVRSKRLIVPFRTPGEWNDPRLGTKRGLRCEDCEPPTAASAAEAHAKLHAGRVFGSPELGSRGLLVGGRVKRVPRPDPGQIVMPAHGIEVAGAGMHDRLRWWPVKRRATVES